MAEIKRCKTPFAVDVNGMTRVVPAGELVSTDDPVYSPARAEYFEDIAVHVEAQAGQRARAAGGTIEAATAAPGEKRAVGRPARKAADDK